MHWYARFFERVKLISAKLPVEKDRDNTSCPHFLKPGWADSIRGFVSSWEIVPREGSSLKHSFPLSSPILSPSALFLEPHTTALEHLTFTRDYYTSLC